MKKKKWYKSKWAWGGLVSTFLIWVISINYIVEGGFPLWAVPLGFVSGLLIDKFLIR